ncbi:uncharacterized protein MELLADRAFT_86134 [Melampsora larici-populina 98AG31]|uniref:GCM domain-containing protein n=1 Tax=Melampsora larici-populina (strain 98AG31 / pathotype 3-4-7) TaxID=747676 RepID=F4RLE6_MELLP|nr:uncharacterized protein MELLADRAFT_86134 [Melampsora larici-populina 98AG31]EGG07011.1 hypothetical protein MELLADRAFT_86134 [Melampsora larici-populina 98AG31]
MSDCDYTSSSDDCHGPELDYLQTQTDATSIVPFAATQTASEANHLFLHPAQINTTSTSIVPFVANQLSANVQPHSPQAEKKKKRRDRPKKTGKKFKIPVPATGELQTYNDHGSKCDGQGYPSYPNGNTVFVRTTDMIDYITNFGFIAYPHTQKSQGSKNGPWKTTWYTCLGVLHCHDNYCNYAAPPLTANGKAAEMIKLHPICPAVECNGNHVWTRCTTTNCRVNVEKSTGWAVLCHSGSHNHVWPAPKKADPLAMLKLTDEQVGQAGAGQTITAPPVIDIHPAFSNGGRLGYLCRKVLVEKGLMPEKESLGGGDRLIMNPMHWGRNGLRLILTSLLGADVHITFQSKWMAEQLVRHDQNGKTYSGGLLSDVTYRFFHNGYLLTTSMYSDLMTRWIPIQLKWIWGLETNHYRAHFTTLLKQIKNADLTHHERELLGQHVVDFSTAQKKGFIAAYMEEAMNIIENLLLGSKKNCNVVDAAQVGYFEQLAMDLLEPNKPDGMTLGNKFDQLGRLFPKAKAWLDWWNTSDIHSMLFCARPRLPLDNPPNPADPNGKQELPDTTNAQESMHRQYYILSLGHCTIVQGFVQLLLFVESLNKDFNQLRRGIPVKYGSSWELVVETLGWSKERTLLRPQVNDERPPDTTDSLICPKKLGRPVGSGNVNCDPHSSYQSYSASSQPGKQNRCWETATLESFLPTFGPLWIEGSKGLKSLQSGVQLLSPASFVTDMFCSADGFIEHLLVRRNRPTLAGRLFAFNVQRDYQCVQFPSHQESETVEQTTVVLTQAPSTLPNRLEDDMDVMVLTVDPTGDVPRLYKRSRLDFTKNPPHVYFHLGGVAGLSHEDRASFMNDMNRPETLTLNNIEYHIVSRGFWAYNHYWCKLVRHLDGARGVWFFDDRKDDGRAQLLGRDMSLISGAQPSTSWLIYSRKPTTEEQKTIDLGIAKIIKKNPDPLGDVPFVRATDLDGLEKQILEDSPVTDGFGTVAAATIISSQNQARVAFTLATAVRIEPANSQADVPDALSHTNQPTPMLDHNGSTKTESTPTEPVIKQVGLCVCLKRLAPPLESPNATVLAPPPEVSVGKKPTIRGKPKAKAKGRGGKKK